MSTQLTIFGTLEADFTVKPWRDPGVTRVYPTPEEARDGTLAAHAKHSPVLIAQAVAIAREQCAADGVTCGPRVLTEMRRRGLLPVGVDTRFLGAVLLPSQGFVNTRRYENLGSKGRAVPLWEMR